MTPDEAVAQAAAHALSAHGLTEISDEVIARVHAAVRGVWRHIGTNPLL
jgi:predicted small metal-binding protein